jgi:hypothetical protein
MNAGLLTGTSAAGHLFSGLVQLAILALAAGAYLRVRAGARARGHRPLAGLPAGLSGAEAIYYAGKGGLSGDDYTGLLSMAAVPVLRPGPVGGRGDDARDRRRYEAAGGDCLRGCRRPLDGGGVG